jgi:hypothetical protein
LTSASRRQDHTASPSTTSAHSSHAPSRPPHPAPNVRDDRETPLFVRQDDAECAGDLGSRSTATQWHDGQITFTLRKRVKCQANAASSVIPGRSRKRVNPESRCAAITRVPDAAQHPSWCAADPGPMFYRMGPGLAAHRCALRIIRGTSDSVLGETVIPGRLKGEPG